MEILRQEGHGTKAELLDQGRVSDVCLGFAGENWVLRAERPGGRWLMLGSACSARVEYDVVVVNCVCRTPPFHYTHYDTIELGEDARGAEVSLSTCKFCGQAWLNYLIEEPQYSRSGRWWWVAVPADRCAAVTAAMAREFIEAQREGFVGGSFFNSSGRSVVAPIRIV